MTYRDTVRAHRPAGQRAVRPRRRPGRHGRRDGLGQPPLPRVLLRRADDGRRAADGECPPVARADPLHAQPRQGRCRAGQRRIRAVAGDDQGPAGDGEEVRPDQRRPAATWPRSRCPSPANTRRCSTRPRREYDFPDFDENTRATTFYTTGTTGLPKGVYFSHRQLVLHTLAVAAALGTGADQGRLHRGDVYMPITPMFHVHAWGMPYVATMLGVKQVYPGRYAPDTLLELHPRREGHVLALRADHPAHAADQPGGQGRRFFRLEGHHRRLGAAQGPGRKPASPAASTSSPATACRKPARS